MCVYYLYIVRHGRIRDDGDQIRSKIRSFIDGATFNRENGDFIKEKVWTHVGTIRAGCIPPARRGANPRRDSRAIVSARDLSRGSFRNREKKKKRSRSPQTRVSLREMTVRRFKETAQIERSRIKHSRSRDASSRKDDESDLATRERKIDR